ncbi:hypothetical protein SCALM49S_06131 [Streptomyces californicus]
MFLVAGGDPADRPAAQLGSRTDGKPGVEGGPDRGPSAGLVLLLHGGAGGQQRLAFTLGPLLFTHLLTALTGFPLPGLQLAALGGLAFKAFTLGLLLFTHLFTAFTGLTLGPLPRLRPLAFLPPCGFLAGGLFTGDQRFMLTLFTRQQGCALPLLTLPPLLCLTALVGSLFALCPFGLELCFTGRLGGG